MADIRDTPDPTQALADLMARVDSLESTLAVQAARLPTGSFIWTFRPTPTNDALFCDGSTQLRAAYPTLFQFAVDNVILGGTNPVFGIGDGSTTFVLPNLQGRLIMGAGTLGADTYVLAAAGGATLKTLVTANLPPHTHGVAVATHGNHGHNLTGGSVPDGGSHGGHFPGDQYVAAAGGAYGLAAWNSGGSWVGDHGHGAVAVFADANSAGGHSVTENSVGTATGVDVRPAYYVMNAMVYT
jgi:microcystin-dependent protein